jgi:hypothetical protein
MLQIKNEYFLFNIDNRMVQSRPTYPVLMAQAPLVQAPPVPYVQALYSYKAKHTDELDLEEGFYNWKNSLF